MLSTKDNQDNYTDALFFCARCRVHDVCEIYISAVEPKLKQTTMGTIVADATHNAEEKDLADIALETIDKILIANNNKLSDAQKKFLEHVKTDKTMPYESIPHDEDMSELDKTKDHAQYGPVDVWDVRSVTSMNDCFKQYVGKELNLAFWDTRNATTMRGMFHAAPNLESVNLRYWDTRNVKNMRYMFAAAPKFGTRYEDKPCEWDTGNVEDMCRMFERASEFDADLSKWNTGNVKDMRSMFEEAKDFEGGDLSKWDTSKVENMSFMFKGASKFKGTGLEKWDTSIVKNMSSMFSGASEFNCDLSKWKTGLIIKMSFMFNNASAFTGEGLSDWDIQNVKDMDMDYMFNNAVSLIETPEWDIQMVKKTENMFKGTPFAPSPEKI